MADAEQIGWYGSAARLFEAALTAPLAFGAVVTPRLVQAFAAGVGPGTALYALFARVVTMGATALALGGFVLAGPAVDLLLPAEYGPAKPLLAIMLVGYPFLSLHLLNVTAMLSLQAQRRPALLMTALVATQAGIAVLMVASSGEVGAAQALVFSTALAALASSVAVRLWLTSAFVLFRASVPALAGAMAGGLPLALIEGPGLATQAMVLVLAGVVMTAALYLVPLGPEPTRGSGWKTAEPVHD